MGVAVLHAELSAGGGAGRGGHGRGRGWEPLPRFQRGDRGGGGGTLPPARGKGHSAAGRAADPHVRHGFLLRRDGGAGGEAGGDRSGGRGAPRCVRKLGGGSHGGVHQAGAVRHRARQDHRLLRRVSRAHHGGAFAHRAQGGAARALRAADSGGGSRAVSQLLPLPVRPGARGMRGGVREVHREHPAEDGGAAGGDRRHRGGAGAGRGRVRGSAARSSSRNWRAWRGKMVFC